MSDQIKIEERDGTMVVQFFGRLDAQAVSDVKEEARRVAEHHRIVLNLANVDFVDSSGLGLLVSIFRRVQERGASLVLCCLCAQVQTIFELTRLHRVFDIYETEEEALAC